MNRYPWNPPQLKELFRHEQCPFDNWHVHGTFNTSNVWKLRQVIKSSQYSHPISLIMLSKTRWGTQTFRDKLFKSQSFWPVPLIYFCSREKNETQININVSWRKGSRISMWLFNIRYKNCIERTTYVLMIFINPLWTKLYILPEKEERQSYLLEALIRNKYVFTFYTSYCCF